MNQIEINKRGAKSIMAAPFLIGGYMIIKTNKELSQAIESIIEN